MVKCNENEIDRRVGVQRGRSEVRVRERYYRPTRPIERERLRLETDKLNQREID